MVWRSVGDNTSQERVRQRVKTTTAKTIHSMIRVSFPLSALVPPTPIPYTLCKGSGGENFAPASVNDALATTAQKRCYEPPKFYLRCRQALKAEAGEGAGVPTVKVLPKKIDAETGVQEEVQSGKLGFAGIYQRNADNIWVQSQKDMGGDPKAVFSMQFQVCCNKVKRFSCDGSMSHAGVREGGRGGGRRRGGKEVGGRRRGGGGEVGRRRGGGMGGGEVGIRKLSHEFRMNHAAYCMGSFSLCYSAVPGHRLGLDEENVRGRQ